MTVQAGTVAMEYESFPWWLVLIEGIVAVLIGVLLLSAPAMTTVILIQVLGIYWLISGILSVVTIFIDTSLWGWKLLSGLLGIVAGIVVVQHPLWSGLLVPSVYVIMLGVAGILIGIIGLIQSFQGAGWGAALVGILSILFGGVLIASPLVVATFLVYLLGGLAVAGGLIAVIGAFQLR